MDVFGVQRIGPLMADREFIDKIWIDFLVRKKIPFFIRIKEKRHAQHRIDGQQILQGHEALKVSWSLLPLIKMLALRSWKSKKTAGRLNLCLQIARPTELIWKTPISRT